MVNVCLHRMQDERSGMTRRGWSGCPQKDVYLQTVHTVLSLVRLFLSARCRCRSSSPVQRH